MNKLKLWNQYPSWQEAENAWDTGAKKVSGSHPIKGVPHLPDIPGITKETKKFLRFKSIRYLIQHDEDKVIARYLSRRPLRYLLRLLKSLFKKKSYKRLDDFFFYGLNSLEEFKKEITKGDILFVLGFSYCHKPLECPSKRFTPDCIHDLENPVCQQCFIGKSIHALPEKNTQVLLIPTIHYIGEKILELQEKKPTKNLLFLITACEMTLEMFGDFGNMAAIQGIGVRLDGRICNTMRAFELSEKGIKPGLTVVTEPTQKKILDLIQYLRQIS